MKKRWYLMMAVCCLGVAGLTACDTENTSDNTTIDDGITTDSANDAVDDAGDVVEDAVDDAGDMVEDAGDAMENATDNVADNNNAQ